MATSSLHLPRPVPPIGTDASGNRTESDSLVERWGLESPAAARYRYAARSRQRWLTEQRRLPSSGVYVRHARWCAIASQLVGQLYQVPLSGRSDSLNG